MTIFKTKREVSLTQILFFNQSMILIPTKIQHTRQFLVFVNIPYLPSWLSELYCGSYLRALTPSPYSEREPEKAFLNSDVKT